MDDMNAKLYARPKQKKENTWLDVIIAFIAVTLVGASALFLIGLSVAITVGLPVVVGSAAFLWVYRLFGY